jgi:hypothetical protein
MEIINYRELAITLKGDEIDKFRDVLSYGLHGLCDRHLSAPYADILFFIGDLASQCEIELYEPEA